MTKRVPYHNPRAYVQKKIKKVTPKLAPDTKPLLVPNLAAVSKFFEYLAASVFSLPKEATVLIPEITSVAIAPASA